MADPVRGRTFGVKIWRRLRVEMRVDRLELIIALNGPESVIDDERRRIGLGLLERGGPFYAGGLEQGADPLPDHVRSRR